MTPIVIVDDADGAAVVRDELAATGWRLVDGFAVRPAGLRVVLCGPVTGLADAAQAVLAALDGFGLLLVAAAPEDVIDRLVDDLRHLGPVEHRAGAGPTVSRPALRPQARAILGLLAEGHTLGDAASLLGLSRRTADRRLAEAKAILGAQRTTEAVAKAVRGGLVTRADQARD